MQQIGLVKYISINNCTAIVEHTCEFLVQDESSGFGHISHDQVLSEILHYFMFCVSCIVI
jgi:hypothetical protein